MQNVAMRERMFTMRLSEEESRRLDRLADHYGLNAAGVIRFLLKREDDSLGGAPTPPARGGVVRRHHDASMQPTPTKLPRKR